MPIFNVGFFILYLNAYYLELKTNRFGDQKEGGRAQPLKKINCLEPTRFNFQ